MAAEPMAAGSDGGGDAEPQPAPSVQVRGYFARFCAQLFEKCGTLLERCTALIEKVSALIGLQQEEDAGCAAQSEGGAVRGDLQAGRQPGILIY
eukprot:SAG31_NODE_1819_length_7201_cov_9.661504_1_plen_94_part_00